MRRIDHDFGGGHTRADLRDDQTLRQDGTQILRQIQEDLIVLVPGEHVDDPVEGLRAVVGVKGRDA